MLSKLHEKFISAICYLTNDLGWYWLDVLIDTLCYFEVNLRLSKNKDLRDNLYTGSVCAPGGKSFCQNTIPQDLLYCSGCAFLTRSKIASLFYGRQMDGFCYYLNKGDFTFAHPTDLLWDGCKCCGINEEEQDEQEHIEQQTSNNRKTTTFTTTGDDSKYF